VIVAFIMLITIDCVGALSTFWQIQLLGSMASGLDAGAGVAARNDSRQALISTFQTLLFLLAAVTFLIWMYKARSNLPLLRASSLQYSPILAVGSFVIPFYNFVWPYRAMSEIWRASDPNEEGEQSWQWRNPPAILLRWWGLFLVSRLPSTILEAIFSDKAKNIHELVQRSYLLLGGDLLAIPAAAAAILVIRSVDQRQAAGLRRALAPPPASAAPEPA
jgi:hypothetical protein